MAIVRRSNGGTHLAGASAALGERCAWREVAADCPSPGYRKGL